MTLPLLAGWDLGACSVQLPFAALGAWAAFSLAAVPAPPRAAAGSRAWPSPRPAGREPIDRAPHRPGPGALSLVALAIVLRSADAAARAPTTSLGWRACPRPRPGTKYTAWASYRSLSWPGLLPMDAIGIGADARVRPPRLRRRRRRPLGLLVRAQHHLLLGKPPYPLRVRLLGYTLVPHRGGDHVRILESAWGWPRDGSG